MTVTSEIKEAMVRWRKERKTSSKGQARYDLNRWLGEERDKLSQEYKRRLAEIDAMEDEVKDSVPPEVLDLVAKAVQEGVSRSSIRVALGKQSLDETDEIIAIAREQFAHRVETGEEEGFTLAPTGEIHARGWPMYRVTLQPSGEAHESVYLVMGPTAKEPLRSHLRIAPSKPGSSEILDELFEAGVASAMYDLGKGD